MLSTSEGSRALGRMRAFMGVELRLSGAGEIGISFLGVRVRVCVRWLRRVWMLLVMEIDGTWDAIL